MSFTTTDLINKVKLWGAVPEGQPAFSDAQLLDLLTDELRTTIATFITQFREDYFVDYLDYTITANQSSYAIPSRAISTVLKDVKYVDNGKEINVPRVPRGDAEYYTNGFYIQGNKLILLYPENRVGQSLRLYYYCRPNTLVAVTSCAVVSSFDSTTITVTSVPSTWGSTETIDITQAKSPLGIISKDNVATRVGTVFTPATMPSDLAVGDYLSLATESCIPQIPVEVIPMLCQSVVKRVNEIIADKTGLKIASDKYDEIVNSVTSILSPRVVEETKTIVSRSSYLASSNWN